MNNADFGLTLQSLICNHYHLIVNQHAARQFKSNFNPTYVEELTPLCSKIFELAGSEPLQLLTYSQESTNTVQTTSPHNFLLRNGKTLSIRTTKTSDRVPPRTVGQAGYQILNEMFGEIYGARISDQQDVRNLMYDHIHEVMPIMIDHFFLSDYTVFVNRRNLNEINIIKSEEVGKYDFSRDDFSFTRSLDNWTESITLKYKNISISEIQTHKNRTFKFRFIVPAIPSWFREVKETTETLGMTAEAAICDYFAIKKPESFTSRVPATLEKRLTPVVKEAFKQLPKAIRHTGSMTGERGGLSKCSYDFELEGGLRLSVKTNKGNKVCPPDVGQPSAKTCLLYFKGFLPPDTTLVTGPLFKEMVFNHIEKLIPIYVDHLFESDWLLWIYLENERYQFRNISRNEIHSLTWKRELFSFTKDSVHQWNESNTVKYNNKSIGEFQVHQNRNCFKFRFNMPVLISLICQ